MFGGSITLFFMRSKTARSSCFTSGTPLGGCLGRTKDGENLRNRMRRRGFLNRMASQREMHVRDRGLQIRCQTGWDAGFLEEARASRRAEIHEPGHAEVGP